MKQIQGLLLLAAVVCLATSNFSGCGSSSSVTPGTSVVSKEEPNVTFKGLDGKSIPIASLKGKVVLLNFWATWCEPCVTEIPWLIEFQKKYGPSGFTVLGVAMDDEGKSAVVPFVEKREFKVDGSPMTMNYPIALGDDDLASKFGGIIGLPTSWLITRDGKVIKQIMGLANHDDLNRTIQTLLEEPASGQSTKAAIGLPHDSRTAQAAS
jgi:cytochrome c biogenesis protein CcmG, thiol:disulfide interchange protein DsbE